MSLAQLLRTVKLVFKPRGESGKQESTGAMGCLSYGAGKTVLFYARQGGTMRLEDGLRTRPSVTLFDARNHVITHLKKSEWSGFHAEMIILSAMLKVLRTGNLLTSKKMKRTGLKDYFKFFDAAIAANAACCKHCHGMLSRLGIQHPKTPGPSSLTAWWNPLTDEVFPQASTQFADAVPGGTTLSDNVRKFL